MIIPTIELHNMADKKHLCLTAVHHSSKKRLIKSRKRSTDQFRCGGCNITFATICSLHEHCIQHTGNGSYFFNNLTYTAFPKFDTACAFTQVTTEMLDFEIRHTTRDVSIQPETQSCTEGTSKLVTCKRETPVRKSKSQAKLNKIWVTSKKNQNHDQLSTTKDEHQSEPYEDESVYSNTKTAANGVNALRKLNTKYKSNKDKEELNGESLLIHQEEKSDAHINDLTESAYNNNTDNLKDVKVNRDKASGDVTVSKSKPAIRKSKRRNKSNQDLVEKVAGQLGDAHETDEMTASEVLIAISKGISAEGRDNSEDVVDDVEKLTKQKLKIIANPVIEFENNGLENQAVENQHTIDSEVDKTMSVELEKVKSDMKPRVRKKKSSCKSLPKDVKQKCPICGKEGGQALMYYHKYMHMEKKDFTCETCGASFKHPRCLQVHQKQHEEKQFSCDICDAAFHRKEYLKTHMLKHTGEEPYMCDICGKSYREKNNLSRHIRHVHEKVRNYECDVCKERFFRSDHLQNHRLRHTEADKKCKYCPRLFKHPDDLLRHTKTHTGEKKWLCHICAHGFVSVSPYYVHMLKKHGINREESKLLKDKLQAEHKLRLSGKTVESSKDTASQFTSFRTKPVSGQATSSDIPTSVDHSVLTDITYTDIEVSQVSHQRGIQHDFEASEHVTCSLESGDMGQQNTHTAAQVTHYLLGFGDQELTENQTVILEEGTSLDHLEIEIGEVGDAIQLGNIGDHDGVELRNIEDSAGVELRNIGVGGGVELRNIGHHDSVELRNIGHHDSVELRNIEDGGELRNIGVGEAIQFSNIEDGHMKFGEGTVHTVMFVDECSDQIAEEVIIQNQ